MGASASLVDISIVKFSRGSTRSLSLVQDYFVGGLSAADTTSTTADVPRATRSSAESCARSVNRSPSGPKFSRSKARIGTTRPATNPTAMAPSPRESLRPPRSLASFPLALGLRPCRRVVRVVLMPRYAPRRSISTTPRSTRPATERPRSAPCNSTATRRKLAVLPSNLWPATLELELVSLSSKPFGQRGESFIVSPC